MKEEPHLGDKEMQSWFVEVANRAARMQELPDSGQATKDLSFLKEFVP